MAQSRAITTITMMKLIEVDGLRVKPYSPNGGLTWSSNPQAIVAYEQRKELLRLELQNRFARIDEMRDLEPDNFNELHTLESLSQANRKIQARSTVGKAQSDPGRAVSNGYARRLDHSRS